MAAQPFSRKVCDNAVLQMDIYRVLTGYGWTGFENEADTSE
jgi:hypothetical protein